MKRIPIPTVIAAIMIILILVIYSITYQVRFSESVVKIRLGKPQGVVTEAGLKFKWPRPIDEVVKYDTRLRVLDTAETEIKTHDSQNIIVGCFAVWRIQDPQLFYTSVVQIREAEIKLLDRINHSRTNVIGQHNWSDFVNLDNDLVDQKYAQIEQEMLDDCRADILKEYGIDVQRVGIWRISLPEETTASVQKSMEQERKQLAARYKEEGESLKQAIVARANSQSAQIMAFAERKAMEIEGAGVKASQRIFEQISADDTEFFIWLRWLEAMQAALKQKTTIFLDTNDEIFKHFTKPPTEALQGNK